MKYFSTFFIITLFSSCSYSNEECREHMMGRLRVIETPLEIYNLRNKSMSEKATALTLLIQSPDPKKRKETIQAIEDIIKYNYHVKGDKTALSYLLLAHFVNEGNASVREAAAVSFNNIQLSGYPVLLELYEKGKLLAADSYDRSVYRQFFETLRRDFSDYIEDFPPAAIL